MDDGSQVVPSAANGDERTFDPTVTGEHGRSGGSRRPRASRSSPAASGSGASERSGHAAGSGARYADEGRPGLARAAMR